MPEAISNAEKTRAEFETVSNLSHLNILRVLHVFRYQETEKLRKLLLFKTRILENWTVVVMEKHEKNIGELTPEERIHLPNLLQDALGKVQVLYYYSYHKLVLNELLIFYYFKI